ncbi:hypothetical protein ACIOK4_43015 [Streptomyces bottropensis]|uniref:hypothetical protein n=1 Tax=Streptomyces bottropensis TaxID=42235 RepID=UPI00378B98B7
MLRAESLVNDGTALVVGGRINPGKVFDLTLPLDDVERAATKGLTYASPTPAQRTHRGEHRRHPTARSSPKKSSPHT